MNPRSECPQPVHYNRSQPILDEHSHCLNRPEATRRDVKIQELIRPTSNQFTAGIHSASNSFATWAVTLLTVSSLLNNSATNSLLALPPLQPVHYENLHSYSNSLWTLSLWQPVQNGCSHCCSQSTMAILTAAARSQWLFSTASAKSHWLFSLLQPNHIGYSHCFSQITLAVLNAAASLLSTL